MGNAVVAAPLSWIGESLRPYASGGLGIMRTRVEDVFDIFSTDRNLLGVNVGGGAIGFLTERVGVRVDVRYFHSVSDLDERDPISIGDAELSFWRAHAAIVLKY
jgi:opacity protein-like surface antigen